MLRVLFLILALCLCVIRVGVFVIAGIIFNTCAVLRKRVRCEYVVVGVMEPEIGGL